jgi:hypothetical protein
MTALTVARGAGFLSRKDAKTQRVNDKPLSSLLRVFASLREVIFRPASLIGATA